MKGSIETRTYTSETLKEARIETILSTIFGAKPRGGGGRVGRWYCLRNLARYIMEGEGHERALTEIKYNWSAKEGLTPHKAEELAEHLVHLTGPHGETVCKNTTVAGIKFIKWIFALEE